MTIQMPCLTRLLLVGMLTLPMLLGGCGRAFADSANVAANAKGIGATIAYRVERAGYASLGVYDANGLLLRSLLVGEPVKAGEHEVAWDGLDRWGRPAAPGEYEWRVLNTPGFKATYQTTIGTNAAGAPWNVWVGNHTGVTSVAVDGGAMYVGAGVMENVPMVLKQSLDGATHHWRHAKFDPWVGPMAMAVVGDRLFMLQLNGKIQIVGTEIDAEQGRYEGGIPSSRRLDAWNMLWPGDEVPRPLWPGLSKAMDMDGWDDSLAVVWREHDTIRWLDPETGKTQAEKTVVAPQAVAVGAAGVAYILSEERLVRVARDNSEEVPVEIVPAAQLTAPRHLALDRAAGELLVAEGEPSHQVKRFGLDGQLLEVYGRPGGRAYGRYVAKDFLNVSAIATDERGGFLIAEHGTLARTVHIDRQGNALNVWYGPQLFFNFATPDPAHPERIVFMGGAGGDKTLAEVDYENRTWRVVANYRHHDFDGLFPSPVQYKVRWEARRRGGQLFLVTGGNQGAAIVRFDETSGDLLPVARAGNVNRNHPPEIWRAVLAHHGYDDAARAPATFTWSDDNGDGQFQPEEFILGGSMPGTAGYVDDDWNVVFGNADPNQHDGTAWFVLPNQTPAANTPKWEFATLATGPGKAPEVFSRLNRIETRDTWRDADGNVYLYVSANRFWTNDRHGEAWPTNRAGSSRLVKWRANGTLEWIVGRHALIGAGKIAQRVPPGRFRDPTRILGVVNGAIVYGDRVRHPAAAFTTDGLYAGSFFDNRADDDLPDHLYAWWRHPNTRHPDNPVPFDNLTAGSILRIDDDTVLWMPMGEMNTPVYHVDGWAEWKRLSGRVRIDQTPPHASANGTGLLAEYFANPAFAGEPAVTRTDPRIWFERQQDHPMALAHTFPDQIAQTSFSARWRGRIEALLSEEFVFSVYTHDQAKARLWLDGDLILDYWPEKEGARDTRPRATYEKLREVASPPIALKAGCQYDIRLEYSTERKVENPVLSLNWDSFTQERQRIPTDYLYPVEDRRTKNH